WTPAAAAAGTARIRVIAHTSAEDAADVSDGALTIVTPIITVTAPNGSGSWRIGSTQAITFTHNLRAGQSIAPDMSRDGGPSSSADATTPPEVPSGSFSSVATGPATSAARIRASLAIAQSRNDISDVDFSIADPAVTVTSPNGSGSIRIGNTQTITFTHNLGIG